MKSIAYCFLLTIVTIVVCSEIIVAQSRDIKITVNDKDSISKELPFYHQTHAVIIGIDRYKNLNINQQLQNAVRDAKGVMGVLQDKYLFDKYYTLFDEEASREQILKLLQGDLAGAGPEDAVFVFFAGHGYTQKSQFGDDVGFIIPSDGSFQDNEMYKNISMVELRDNISKTLKAKHVFYVMDACYSGTLLAKRSGTSEQTINYDYLKQISEMPVRQVLTAGGQNEQVLDGGKNGHSVFTSRLIERLQQANSYLTASEVGLYVPTKVMIDASDSNTKQNPQFGYLLGEGDFIFIPKPVQNLTPEETLTMALKKLKDESMNLQGDLNIAARLENLKKQEEIWGQLDAIAEKRKLEEAERLKKIEDDRIAADKKAAEEKAALELNYSQAILKIQGIQEKIGQIEKENEEQKQKALRTAMEQAPRGEFETQQEYDQRISGNPERLKKIAGDFDQLIVSNRRVFEDEISKIRIKTYPAPKGMLQIKLGTYNIDQQYFPITVMYDTIPMTDPCDASPIRLFASREEAKVLRTNEDVLDVQGYIRMAEANEAILRKIIIRDSTLNKEFLTSLSGDELTEILPGDCSKMVFVKGGTFQMGSDSGETNEKPRHAVTVSDFYIGKHEVTQKMWTLIMGSNPSKFSGCDSCPVENVSWNDIHDFLQKLNQKTGKSFRLPYEAEWEYAARGGAESKGYVYAGGYFENDIAWHDGNSGGSTRPVCHKLPNECGLFDMSGNVGEWCEDWYDGNYYSKSPTDNPKGASSGTARVMRGGSWFDFSTTLRNASRNRYLPDYRYKNFGFRLCISAQ